MEKYESVILELLTRLKKVEEKLDFLEATVNNLNEQIENEDLDDNDLTRSKARQIAIEQIQKNNPGVKVRKANREEGSGIVVESKDNKTKIKFYYSKSYELTRTISWSAINKEDIEEFAYFIFSIFNNGKLYSLVFSRNSLKALIQQGNKSPDPNDRYHFSFTIEVNIDGKCEAIEVRGPIEVNVTNNLEKFKLSLN